jgi:putative oxidoreductase
MNKFFSPTPLWQTAGLCFIRIIVGGFMIYHGCEIFSGEKMKPYFDWDAFKGFSSPALVVYTGKTAELVAGIFLMIGLFTRLASLVLIFTMLYISFFVGHGKIWYEDQHPFLFVLLGLVFFFTGSGKWSVDQLVINSKK